jgi:hypothetical protein
MPAQIEPTKKYMFVVKNNTDQVTVNADHVIEAQLLAIFHLGVGNGALVCKKLADVVVNH